MRLSGEAYSERLKTFSDTTIELILDTKGISREMARKGSEITTDSTLTEEQIVQKLTELKNSQA